MLTRKRTVVRSASRRRAYWKTIAGLVDRFNRVHKHCYVTWVKSEAKENVAMRVADWKERGL